MADPKIRAIKIKTGVVKRLAKEKTMYEKEVISQGEKIEKMKSEGKDEYDVRKQQEVLEESKVMIGDSRKRLTTAHAELEQLLQQEEDLKETEEYIAAQTCLEDAKSAF